VCVCVCVYVCVCVCVYMSTRVDIVSLRLIVVGSSYNFYYTSSQSLSGDVYAVHIGASTVRVSE